MKPSEIKFDLILRNAWMIVLFSLFVALPGQSALAGGQFKTWYMAPNGSDRNNGLSQEKPLKSFFRAFRKMKPGDELILLDGTYSDKNGNGYIGYEGTHSEQILSGIKGGKKTVVRAKNPGKVTILGQLFVGRSFRKDHDIHIDGIRFEGGGRLYNSTRIYISNCGFHGAFGIGTNDHDLGNTMNLVEDSWIWASGERLIAANYRADKNVWRRVVVRGDGCSKPGCLGSGNPNVGITVYESSNVSVQNVIVVDRVLGGGSPYADFAAAQHTQGNYLFGRNEWLGTLSINSPDSGYYLEPDQQGTLDPTIKINNAVAWNSRYAGINIARAGTNNLLENITVVSSGDDGIRIGPRLKTGLIRNTIVVDSGRFGINSAYPSEYVSVHGSAQSNFNQNGCRKKCLNSDARRDGKIPSLKYPVRIERGSALSHAGSNGSDIGANIVFRYGKDGSYFGQAGYDTLTKTPLWPWKNEYLIQAQMCEDTQRGFCKNVKRLDGSSRQTLTSYIWEIAGHPMPPGIYPK